MKTLHELETPALLIDREILDRNLQRMSTRLAALGTRLRPHVKTAKSLEVVGRALNSPDQGITVSTLKEAEYFFAAGVSDILYGVGIAVPKLDRVIALIRGGARLTLTVDNMQALESIASAAATVHVRIPVAIELDVDGHRAGVLPASELLLQLGRAAAEHHGLELRGVMTHAGGSYDCPSVDAIREMAERERAGAVLAAQRLRDNGLPVEIVSVGSTPTATFATRLDGVTEVRVGVYMFHDLVMANLGVCQPSDIALSALVSVIGHQADRGWIITDGGWMALSRDRGTARQKVDYGYGLVRDVAGRAPADDLVVRAANQEHGIIARRDAGPLDLTRYPVGTLLRILPNHACAMAAQHSQYQVVCGDSPQIVATWSRINGW